MSGYNGNQEPTEEEKREQKLERQADAILAQSQDPMALEQARVLEEARAIIDNYDSLDRVAKILYESEEARTAAEKVINSNPFYSEIFTVDRFLTIAMGFAVSCTYSISYQIKTLDEAFAVADLKEGNFSKAFAEQRRLKAMTEMEELAENGDLHLFEYALGEGTDPTVQ
ncbi:hypothetical protein KY331_03355 [Candidatus Woesearchaeota archaeon]|nr:hypothetical protein [Candidatus Woesearchaeota archaeon]